VEFDRKQWRALRMSTPLALTEEELVGLRGLGEQLDLLEVEEVYLPLARLIHLQVAARQRLFAATAEFLGEPQQNPDRPVPFVIGVAGSVAVGKSTTARVLQALLARWDHHPRVDLVTTDGFLYPNAVLERQGLMQKKGFPESYDLPLLLSFLSDIKSGRAKVRAPVYSHLTYDIVPNQWIEVDRPDILIVEGVNVLQTGPLPRDGKAVPVVSDFFDFSVYIDADEAALRQRAVAVLIAEAGSPLAAWLRRGRAAAAVVRPDRTVARAGRDVAALCAWTASVLAPRADHDDVDGRATITGIRTECSTALLTDPNNRAPRPPRP
jgi:type I pantothenate kinase